MLQTCESKIVRKLYRHSIRRQQGGQQRNIIYNKNILHSHSTEQLNQTSSLKSQQILFCNFSIRQLL
jgi:RAB protein geranylgeranyltransferase component A